MSKKKPKKSRSQGRTKEPPKEPTSRKSPLLIGGVVVGAAAAAVLIVVLIPRTPDRPEAGSAPRTEQQTETRARDQTEQRAEQSPEALRANDAALRDETTEVARQLVEDFPQDAFPLGLMGTVLNQFGNSEEAEKWWRRCLDREPGRADAVDVLAVAYLRKGEFQKVVDLSAEMLVVAPNTPGMHRRLADALLELGELDEE